MSFLDLRTLEAEHHRYQHLLDPETQLPKWGLFLDRTMVALARAGREDAQVVVFVLDFPGVETGRLPLQMIADNLRRSLRPDDTVARLGEHRLAVLCNEIHADEDAAQVARRLLHGAGVVGDVGLALSVRRDTANSLIARALTELDKRVPVA